MIDFGPHSPRDYLRALRDGGPMDRVALTCRCLKCGRKTTETARWYHECEMVCSCGGEIDSAPFREAFLFLSGKLNSLPETVRMSPDIPESSGHDK